MLFNSYAFLFGFLPLVFVAFLALRRQPWRVAFVVVASYGFYAYSEWWFPALMAASTLVSYTAGLAIERAPAQHRGRILAAGVTGVLGMLVVFKYAGFATHNVLSVVSVVTSRGLPSLEEFTAGIVLPVGISFFTFEAISYMVDVYRRDLPAERSLLRYSFFISFFPHLIAGPIVRYGKLAPQLTRFYRLDPNLLAAGLGLIAVGLVKKVVIADGIAEQTDALLADPGGLGFVDGWLAMIGYSFQIYFDFAGYCDMALGLARMFGIELPWNFDRPYRARNPQEFWRRWHVTLSSWLRDYLYIPLGGNRRGPVRRDANLLATMALGGLWHGASFGFVVWGVYQGLLLLAHRHLARFSIPLAHAPAVALTFLAVTVGWVFFRMEGADNVVAVLGSMAGSNGVGAVPTDLLPFLVVAAALMWGVPEEWRFEFGRWPLWRFVPLGLATAAALILVNATSRFIYFRF